MAGMRTKILCHLQDNSAGDKEQGGGEEEEEKKKKNNNTSYRTIEC